MPITFASPWGIKVIRLDKEKCFTFETKVLNEVDSFESSKTITGCYKIEQDMLILSPEYFYTTNKCRDNSQEIKHSSNDLIFLITPYKEDKNPTMRYYSRNKKAILYLYAQ
ncbi:MAG: hypothetical protein IPL35_08385 [Sphingobacteriales bacterium]|nr:hypothetical protein [Sphingobacteriales bacterium]